MFTLITFATRWGSRYGGINSFNTDLLSAFGFAFGQNVKVICFVTTDADGDSIAASRVNVDLVALPYEPRSQILGSEHGCAAIDELARRNIKYDPSTTIWLGHDRITGEAAVLAAKLGGGRSAVIHHMSYVDYEPYAENTQSAQIKIRAQTTLLQSADLVFAVGPLLRDAVVYNLLFAAASETLRTIAADPRHLGADIGFLAVLHTWDLIRSGICRVGLHSPAARVAGP